MRPARPGVVAIARLAHHAQHTTHRRAHALERTEACPDLPVAFTVKGTLGNDGADRGEQRRRRPSLGFDHDGRGRALRDGRAVHRRWSAAAPTRARRGRSRTAGGWKAKSGDSSLRLPPAQRALASRWRIFSLSSSLLAACSATTRLRRCVSSSSTCVSRLFRCASPPARNSSRHAESLAVVTPWRRLRLSRSAPRNSSSTTETLRFADHPRFWPA
jgi:hypothetical protein